MSNVQIRPLSIAAVADATVKVGGRVAQRLGERFFAVVTVGNEAAAIRTNIVVMAFRHDPVLDKDVVACVTGVLSVAKAEESPDYDGNAAMVSNSRFTYTWDAFGRLTGAVNEVEPKTRLAFAYYPDGRRANKTVYRLEGSNWIPVRSHQFFYDDWNLASETVDSFDASGILQPDARVTRRFLWGLDLAGQRSGRLEQEAGGIGGLLAFTVTSNNVEKIYLPVSDASGNIHKIVDAATGEAVAEYAYDPYGRLISDSLMHFRNNELTNFPLRFQSKYYDTETGLYYFGYRYYDPVSCKWLCRDPLQEQGGINLTAYCNGDPVNAFDPLGLAIGDLWDPRTYVFNPIGMSGTEAAGRARIARDATDKMLGYAGIASVAGSKEAGTAISSIREGSFSYWTRMSRYYEMGIGEANVSIGDQLGARYEAEGSMYFEMLPVIGNGYKSFTGEVIDDRGDGIHELSSWGRAGYGALSVVEAGLIASPWIGKAIAARSGSASEVIPKTLAQGVGPVVNSTSSSAGAGGRASSISDELVTITHRGTPESIARKVAQGNLPSNLPRPNNALTRLLDHPRSAVWVSEGSPTWWNRLWSGMVGRRGSASISFEVPRNTVQSPSGWLKRWFGRSQRVIEQDVPIPPNARINNPGGSL
jgi:RHS repeat-associated protein